MKLTFYYIVVGVSILSATVYSVYSKIVAIRELMNTALLTDFTTQGQINTMMFEVVGITIVGFIAFALASFIFALTISHRIAGPTVAILAYIHELKMGNYDYGRKLRANDELTLIMDALHDLTPVLKEREHAISR
jgi:signal transduction histidine kinase